MRAVAGGADQVLVARVEEEVVQQGVGGHSAHLCLAVFDGDFPGFGNVFQGSNKAASGWCGVDGAYPGALSGIVFNGDKIQHLQIGGVEQHHGVGQVVCCQHIVAVSGNCDVAHVDAGANFGHHFQIVDIVFGNPAIPGAKVHITAVRAVFGAAVQGEAAGEAVDGLHFVAIEQGDMVVADFHDQEQVHQVRLKHRLIRQ